MGGKFSMIRRREFITLLGGAAVAWPWTAGAQNGTRRIGVFVQDNTDTTPLFVETLGKLGWIEGQNVHINYRTFADPESLHVAVAELIALHPDVIFAPGLSFLAARAQTQKIPIVFAQITDPVARGFVASLRRPGGNVTGFTNFEASLGGKWLGLLKGGSAEARPLSDAVQSRRGVPRTALPAFRRSGVARVEHGDECRPGSHRC
jgi:putative tryptophan/tyrosine transport system substrate-binding protein